MDWEKILEDLVNDRNSRKRSKTITAVRPSGSSSSYTNSYPISYDFASLYPSQMQSYGRYDRRPIKR